ncbi:hypothetical protein KRMM14A1259_13960 [Krasilnikovia sp. MM14-A1259]
MGPPTADTEWYISAGMVSHVGDAVTVTCVFLPARAGHDDKSAGALASFGVIGIVGNRPTGRF